MEGQEYFTGKNEKLEFREIVLSHLKKFIDLSLHTDIHDSSNNVKIYKNAVLSFADILLPFYDEEMTEYYEKYETSYNNVLKEQLDKDFNIKHRTKYNVLTKSIHRQLFRQLNLLLKRVEYLKGIVYSEDQSEGGEIVDTDKK